MEIEYTADDAKTFEGEWKWTKRWQRVDERDIAEVELCELARATSSEWVPAARQKQTDLGFESDVPQAIVRGNRLLLHELVANLIDNAIRYTPERGKVTVRVARTGHLCT